MTTGGWICAAIVRVVVISIIAFSAGRSSIGAAAEAPWALLAATDWRQIVALYDERFFRMWEFYLAGTIVVLSFTPSKNASTRCPAVEVGEQLHHPDREAAVHRRGERRLHLHALRHRDDVAGCAGGVDE